MAGLLHNDTSGYPYLVSRLCKLMDEKVGAGSQKQKKAAWSKDGLLAAVRMLLSENDMLFESLTGKLADYPELNRMLRELLFQGKPITYSPTNQAVGLARMFGFVKIEEGKVLPANRIFDTMLYDYFLSAGEADTSDLYKASMKSLSGPNPY